MKKLKLKINIFALKLLCRDKDIEILFPGKTREEAQKQLLSKFWKSAAVLFIAFFLLLEVWLVAGNDGGQIISSVPRNGPGQGTTAEQVTVSSGEKTADVTINIKERKPDADECERLAEECFNCLFSDMENLNGDLSHITKNLILPTEEPDFPFKISYKSENTNILKNNGKIVYNEPGEEGTDIVIWSILRYEEYEYSKCLELKLFPPEYTENQKFLKKIKEALEKADSISEHSEKLELPSKLEGEEAVWKTKTRNESGKIAAAFLTGTVLLIIFMREKVNRAFEKRSLQLSEDYSELVSRLTVLIGAGMTVNRAFRKISDTGDENRNKHFVYAEIKRMLERVDCGVTEQQALEDFGKRCGGGQYLRFAMLISQNLRKGNSEILKLLQAEAAESYRERRELIKRKGEEVGTKLLIPMTGMMLMVFIIVLYPALSGL